MPIATIVLSKNSRIRDELLDNIGEDSFYTLRINALASSMICTTLCNISMHGQHKNGTQSRGKTTPDVPPPSGLIFKGASNKAGHSHLGFILFFLAS